MNWFRHFVAWLHLRFPVQLVVASAEFQALREEVARRNGDVQMLYDSVQTLKQRIVQLESQLSRLNAASGFVSSAKGFNLER